MKSYFSLENLNTSEYKPIQGMRISKYFTWSARLYDGRWYPLKTDKYFTIKRMYRNYLVELALSYRDERDSYWRMYK